MALAEVVSLLAVTNRTSVSAYARPMAADRQVQFLRALGMIARMTRAAISERKPATCQLLSEVALITAPPVENSSAAPAISSLFLRWDEEDEARYLPWPPPEPPLCEAPPPPPPPPEKPPPLIEPAPALDIPLLPE